MMLDSDTLDALGFGDHWTQCELSFGLYLAYRSQPVPPAQRRAYDRRYRAKRAKSGRGKHAGHLSGAAWHAARAAEGEAA